MQASQAKPGFPKAILSCAREEYDELELTILERTETPDGEVTYVPGRLPEDLQGHAFIVGPVGSVASDRIPGAEPETVMLPDSDNKANQSVPILNGDGMLYRFDFHQTPTKCELGKVWLTTRLVKPPSYYADKLTYGDRTTNKRSRFWSFRFFNLGVARFSLRLGICNQVNTGLQPMKLHGDPCDRLIVTNDASRPYEVDPASLQTLAPVGLNADWKPLLKISLVPSFPFQGVMTGAHPCYDPHSHQLFLVNVQKSLNSLLRVPFSYRATGEKSRFNWWEVIGELVLELVDLLLDGLNFFLPGVFGRNKAYLARWQGETRAGKVEEQFQQWPVVLPTGKALNIRQSCHTMGLTENYLVLVDTAFKLSLADMLPSASIRTLRRWLGKVEGDPEAASEQEAAEKEQTASRVFAQEYEQLHSNHEYQWLKSRLDGPQSPDTYVYVIAREQLERVQPGDSIVAQPFTVAGEFAHFVTDYRETDGHIVLHPAMTYATDPSEFISRSDQPVHGTELLPGMFSAPVDVNSPATVAIDPVANTVRKYELELQEALQYSMFLGLFAYRDDVPTQQFTDLYWVAGAAGPRLFTQRVYELYRHYQYRQVPASEIYKALAQPNPTFLTRVRLNRQQLREALKREDFGQSEAILRVADRYEFSPGYIVNSPVFIPRGGDQIKGGYLLCDIVYSDHYRSQHHSSPAQNWSDNSAVWIFDADNLAQGPLYKLSHPYLNWGLTLHTTWMQDLTTAPARDYDVKADFQELVARSASKNTKIGQRMHQLFEEIYDQFNVARRSPNA
ncbi:MAG: carotenoid oxygenase family protein [Cyanophyceae cyanobacterium]